MTSPMFADIVFPINVDQPFTYLVPESLVERAAPGMRALAPMRNRTEMGYIVAVKAASSVENVRPIIDIPDETPVFSATLLELCRWMADYYCCSWGEALQCALPAGVKSATRMRYRLSDQLAEGRLSERQGRILAALYERGPLTERQLAAVAGAQALSNTLRALVKRSLIIAEPVTKDPGVSVLTETWVRLIESAIPGPEALIQLQRRAPKQAAVYFDLMHGAPERAATELYARHQVESRILNELVKRELIERFERELYRAPEISADPRSASKHSLNTEQHAAWREICAAAEAHRYQTLLLRGVTGSGKTEVYLQAIERILELGRDAIILVPEISLTPQTVGRFYARFQQAIAVLHSGLSQGERFDEWRRAQRGEVRIVVGARSAVFAPLPRLGMIIVDEEHDTSYKQGEAPRYHARDVAIVRARMQHAVCVLGSATPSIESYYNTQHRKSTCIELTQRATRGELPQVKLIDMREEMRETNGQIILSRVLEEAVHLRVKAGEQVILLLNRRGFAPFVLCPQCGWVAQCDNCQVSLTYHSAVSALKCHYCNTEYPRPQVCGKCHFNPLIYLGVGTQKAEDYLMRAFPEARVARMDADTTAGKGGHAKILGRFAAGEIDILIGTQMLAKGHDYPGVTLVGVINADSGLAMPDFRASEQTFQLLTQVAGRAGRGDRPGEVYFQTYRPKHYAIQAAAAQDYAQFYTLEIDNRREAGYPPFRRMAHFTIESEDPELAEREGYRLRNHLQAQIRQEAFKGVEVVGPAPALVRRVNKLYRWHLALFAHQARQVNAVARIARDQFAREHPGGKVKLKINLDPYGMS